MCQRSYQLHGGVFNQSETYFKFKIKQVQINFRRIEVIFSHAFYVQI